MGGGVVGCGGVALVIAGSGRGGVVGAVNGDEAVNGDLGCGGGGGDRGVVLGGGDSGCHWSTDLMAVTLESLIAKLERNQHLV